VLKNFLNRLDPAALDMLRQIGLMAKARKCSVYAVGGCVRDLILKRRIVDLDVVVEGDGIALARQFSSAVGGRLTAYPQFATATVALPNGRAIDFSSARKERYAHPGALPSVSEGNIHDDLFRRDFTVNALAMSIGPDCFGTLVDDYKGFNDIKRKAVRILHDRSFRDDPTRLLRAVRFEQRFGFHLEPKTLRLLREAVKAKAEQTVKPQRYFEEFKKNLKEDKAFENLKRLSSLDALGFLGVSFKTDGKNVRLIKKISANGAWAHKHLADWPKENVWLVHFMAVANGASPTAAEAMMDRFNFSKVDRKKVIASFSAQGIVEKLAVRRLTPSETFELLRSSSIEEILFLRSRAQGANVRRRLEQYLLKWRYLKLQINGEDLKAAGLVPGREFQVVLGKVLLALVEGQCTTRSEQLKYVQSLCQK
jgi:tRNA nucleotidyltransferase (CCA-adding enzyme)